MKGIDKYVIGTAPGAKGTGVVLADGALADANMTEIDWGALDLTREFTLNGRITPNTTAPGANLYLCLNWYWSDFKITSAPGTNVPLLCPTRKHVTGPMLLPNLTLANNGERYVRFRPAESLNALTITASTTTATITFPPNYQPRINVGDLVMVTGGVVTGNGNLMQGVYPLATVTHTSGANGQIVCTATYTITSSTGTLVQPNVFVERTIKRGANDDGIGEILRPLARFMYVSVDRSALTALATTELVVAITRIPSREKLI